MLTRARTMLALGLRNVARVAVYRGLLRAGRHPVQRLAPPAAPEAPFFDQVSSADAAPDGALADPMLQFGWFSPPASDAPPDWHANLIFGTRAKPSSEPWWRIPDFDPTVGDIKTIWEASRWDWVVTFAQRARRAGASARGRELARLDAWIVDWCRANPAYEGVNWKCGQEASIRVLHLAVAARVLGTDRTLTPGLRALLRMHLARIAPTVAYAQGQENNHGTSEAAALFIGGSWLVSAGSAEGAAYEAAGRQLLDERVAHLFAPDGSFSQYSVNYHRLALDTCALAEVWRGAHGRPPFADVTRARLAAATAWLDAIVEPADGDAPNLGHNDGANLLRLTDAPYRDHRPSVRLAGALFEDRDRYAHDARSAQHLAWLGVACPERQAAAPVSRLFDDGGTAVLHRGRAMALLRFPRDRFRPAQADPLHVDLWVEGAACLRDGGTYSYAHDPSTGDALAGVEGHNTIQFDGAQPMPRLGRFLWGDWLRTEQLGALREADDRSSVDASYTTRNGVTHRRAITLGDGALVVEDEVRGETRRATLRWRLRPGAWRLDGECVSDGGHTLRVDVDGRPARIVLIDGIESTHYLRWSTVPVLEVTIEGPTRIRSEYRWVA